MADLLRGPRLKIQRAKKHIADLNCAIGEYGKREPYVVIAESHPDPRYVTAVAHIREEMPEDFPLLIGDAVHNIRSALNVVVCAFVPPPSVGNDFRDFPIAKDAKSLECALSRTGIDKARPQIAKIARRLKSYTGGNSRLCAIRDLNDRDKHRLMITVFQSPTMQQIDLGYVSIAHMRLFFSDDGEKIMTFPKTDYINVGDELAQSSFGILFGPGPCDGKDVVSTLKELVHFAENVVGLVGRYA